MPRLRLSNLSIFPKLILIFLLIVAPLFGLSLALNEMGKREVQQQLNTTMSSQIHYYFKSLEKEIQQIIRAQEEMVNDEDLQKLTGLLPIMSKYEMIKGINQLGSKIKKMRESSAYIAEIRLYVPALEKIIASSSGQGFALEELKQIAQAAYEQGSPLITHKGRLYVSHSFPPYSASGQSQWAPQFIMHVELSSAAIQEELGKFHQHGETVLFNDGWWISSEAEAEAEVGGGQFQAVRDELPGISEQAQGTFSISLGQGNRYVGLYEYSASLNTTLLFFLEEDLLLGTLKAYRTWFWLIALISVAIVILFSYGIYLLIHRPLRTLVKLFRNVERGNFQVEVPLSGEDEFGYLFKQFAKMLDNVNQLINETYIQKLALQRSELKQLQSQINPHFLYNSFFTLHRLIKNYDVESAQLISKNLGEYFQYITRNARDEVTLEDEIGHVRSFSAIQGLRFAKRMAIEFPPLPPELAKIEVPRLILQPIIENVFEHGLGEKMRAGLLRIRYAVEEGVAKIIVEDNGALKAEDLQLLEEQLQRKAGGESTGLVNVDRRLQLKFGEPGGLVLARSPLGGLQVTIQIPIGGAGNAENADRR